MTGLSSATFFPFLNLSFFFHKLRVLDQMASSSKLLLGSPLNQLFFLTRKFLLISITPLFSQHSGLSFKFSQSETSSYPCLLSTVLLQHLSHPVYLCPFCTCHHLRRGLLKALMILVSDFCFMHPICTVATSLEGFLASTSICRSSHLILPCQVDLLEAQV